VQGALLLIGWKQLGEPDREEVRALESITDLDRLDRLGEYLSEAQSWRELLRSA
jgi:hypothetical protein